MKEHHSRSSAIVPVLFALGFGACSAWALTKDVHNNYRYFVDINADIAGVLAMTAVLAALIPAYAGWSGWCKWKAAATALCIAIACWAAANVYADDLGKDLSAKTTKADNYTSAQTDAARARELLARITEASDAETLSKQAAKQEAEAERLAKLDAETMGDKNACLRKCREARETHMKLLERLGQAKARDKANEDLQKATAAGNVTGKVEVSMLASQMTGNEKDATGLARWFVVGTAFLGIVATQVALLMSHWSVTLMADAYRILFPVERQNTRQKPNTRSLRPATAEAPQQPARKRSRGRPGKMSREEAYAILQARADKVGGSFFGSKTAIANELGVSPNTLTAWLDHWTKQNMVTVRKVSSKDVRYIVPARKAA